MTRTSLLAALQRVSQTARAAEQAGVDAAEAAGRRHAYLASDEAFSRRQVLTAGVVGAAAASTVGGKSDERFKIVGGNQQLSLAQAAELGSANMALGWTLTGAHRQSDVALVSISPLERRAARLWLTA